MRIFVTGANGFIGRHVVPELVKDGHELLILSRVVRKAAKNTKVIAGDLQDLQGFRDAVLKFDPHVCVHLAWEGIPDYSYEVSKSNLDVSLALMNFLVQETNCRKIIAGGSSWEYGKTRGVCKEIDPPAINSPFVWAKNALQVYGAFACAARKVDFVWLRIFFAYGPGQKEHSLIPTLYRALKAGKTPDIRAPHNAQDFVYAGDVARAFVLAVRKNIPSGIYNIGTGRTVKVGKIRRMVEAAMFGKPLYRENTKAPSGAVNVRADIAKFQNACGWRPIIGLEQGIKNQIESLEKA